ncbi:hypothetical protein INE90_03859 [Bacteroides uniformis]|nr:hypothetical protein INE90_03859 [Bacteroides uniformis]
MKKSRRTYNGVHLNKKSNTQDVVEQSLTLQSYVNEFVFRYNTRKISENSRFNLLLCNTNYRITYKKLIA